MKNKIILFFAVIIMCLTLAACGAGNDQGTLTYTPNSTTEQADSMFENGNTVDLQNLCEVMAGNNDHPEERDNFFNYILAKVVEFDTTDDQSKYSGCLEVIETCLNQPLTQAHVVSGLKQAYVNMDTKLTEQTKQYMTGKWRRIDNTIMSGMIVEVFDSEEFGFCSKVVALPDGSDVQFKINDIKWNDIQFANHKKFYLHDLVTEESSGTTYYKNDSKTVTKLKGATATINFEKDTIVINYDAASGVTTGSHQVWLKVGSVSDTAYQAGDYYDNDNSDDDDKGNDENAETNDEDDGDGEENINDFSLSGGRISNTTATATSISNED